MLRHHRLLERYLVDRLGLALDEVHAEAELLEHALSEELEAKIDAELGFPTHDPHGDPIPTASSDSSTARAARSLDLEPGERASIARVPDGDSELLRYLGELGLVPGSSVEVVAHGAVRGPVTVRTQRRASTRSRASSRTASPRRRSSLDAAGTSSSATASRPIPAHAASVAEPSSTYDARICRAGRWEKACGHERFLYDLATLPAVLDR